MLDPTHPNGSNPVDFNYNYAHWGMEVGVRNSTKAEMELVLKKSSTISTKRTGLCKTPERERKREAKREIARMRKREG